MLIMVLLSNISIATHLLDTDDVSVHIFKFIQLLYADNTVILASELQVSLNIMYLYCQTRKLIYLRQNS